MKFFIDIIELLILYKKLSLKVNLLKLSIFYKSTID